MFHLKEETRYWILAVTFLFVALFFVFAAFQQAGIAGKKLYEIAESFLGLGYYLLPVIFTLLAFSLVRERKRPAILTTSIAGAILLFISGLGLLSTLGEKGGSIGSLVSFPLISFLDVAVTTTLLLALFLVSLLFIFDTAPSFTWLSRIPAFFKFIWKKIHALIKRLVGANGSASEKESALQDIEETSFSDDKEIPEESEEEEYYDEDEEVEESEKKSERESSQKPDEEMHKNKTAQRKADLLRIALSPGKKYTPPPLELVERDKGKPGVGDLKANANIIKRTLKNFGIEVEMDEISVGPSVTRYAFKPAQGIKLSRIVALQNDLALALAAHPLRIEAPIPGRSLVGIEVPNNARATVGLATLLSEKKYAESNNPLFIPIGRDVTGKPYLGDLDRMPHLLVAGATGSGKSVSIHSMIISLLYRNAPEMLRFILIDPKRVELTLYKDIPHLLTPVITNAKKAILALKWVAHEMDRRYDILETESARDITSYHKNIVEPAYADASAGKMARNASSDNDLRLPEALPYIVVIIDELADIMSSYPRELEAAIVRLAQMSRAVGIHLILSTQRPSVNVITGLIKANIPTRIAFQVASQTDSRTILDVGGAEKLLGAGDMLYLASEMSKPTRLQSPFISEKEIKKVVSFLGKEKDSSPGLLLGEAETQNTALFTTLDEETLEAEDDNEDELYQEARDTVVRTGKASTTFLQRRLRIGYARAARLMDALEENGVVGPADGAKPRAILVEQEDEQLHEKEEDSGIRDEETDDPNDDEIKPERS